MLPALTTRPLDATVLAGGVAVRLVAGAPPAALLDALYGSDARVALAVLAETDPVLRRALGGVHLVEPGDWPTAAGAGWILAPFVRAPGPHTATRFSDGSYGVWYGAADLVTAQAEVGHHLAAYLAKTEAAPDRVPRRVLHAVPSVDRPVVDLRGAGVAPAGVLDPLSYAAAQAFGAACRRAQHWGLVWPSVRREGGTCIGVLRPPMLVSCTPVGATTAEWDGRVVAWHD